MAVNEEITLPRSGLSGTRQALLERRLLSARQTSANQAGPQPAIPRRAHRPDIPLSFAQEQLWFLDQLEPSSPVYNVCQAVRLSGPLNVPALERGLNEIIRRHETLRTNFVAVDGSPVQVIAARRTLALTVVKLESPRDVRGEEELHQLTAAESRKPFDLSRDLLLRVLLAQLGPHEHVLMLTMHHIVSDAWSLGVFFHELALHYAATAAGEPGLMPELPVQYADFAVWEREHLPGAALEKQLAFWKKQLGGNLPVLELPADHSRVSAPMSRGAAQTLQFSPELTHQLKALGQQEKATVFMTLLAAFQVLLHRYTGQEDIIVGSAVAGRRHVQLEKLIGFFVNTLVLRGDLTGNPTFRELLGRGRDMVLGALEHQDLSFMKLVQELRPDRSTSRNPLFQVMFVLQNAAQQPVCFPGLQLEALEVDAGTAKFDLTLSMMETPQGLRAALDYNADLFERETMARLLGNFQTLLEAIVADPDRRIAELPLLTAAERHELLVDWNKTVTDYPREKTIAQLFEEQVAQTPEAVAVTCEDRWLTYRELDTRAGQLARHLRQAGVQPDTLVGVCLERSIELIIALLGILKAGGAYVSFDPAYPMERLAFIFKDTQATVLLTQEKLRATVAECIRAQPGHAVQPPPVTFCLDTDWAAISATNGTGEPRLITANNLAYVSYPSGSAGVPRGVCVTHRGVVRLVKHTNFARFAADDVFLQFAPISFDASTLEIWGPLLNGGRLVVFPPGQPTVAELGEAIQKNGITTLWLTAGLFHQMVEEQVERLQNVRQLLAGGDVLSASHVARAWEKLPRTRLINGYGPTENTTFTCCHCITGPLPANRSVPIGRPVAHTQVYLLDAHLQPVPVGVPGELYAAGDGLARGYLHRPEQTEERFIPHPFSRKMGARIYRTGDRARWLPDGSIEFLGRIDRQVKVRGFRVEPVEIEVTLGTHPLVKECAVVAGEDASGTKRLAAYIVPRRTPAPAPEFWRDFLKDKLPDYMVPSAFVPMEALPRSPDGKIDCSALPPLDARPGPGKKFAAPRDRVEEQLAAIWTEVLGVHPVGVHDHFFDLGGHSLLAVRLMARIEKTFGKKLSVAMIFQQPTIEQLGQLLRGPITAAPPPVSSLVEIRAQGSRPPLYFVHGVGGGMFWGYSNLARHLSPDQPVYAFKSRGLDGLEEWPTIEEMAAHYVADLRALQPRGPYLLGGYCFGGNVAHEMACQLHAQGEQTALIALINCVPPNTAYVNTRFIFSLRWMAKFLRNLAFWLGAFLFHWKQGERRDFVRWKFRLLGRKLAKFAGLNGSDPTEGRIDQLVDLSAFVGDQRRLWEGHIRALIRYKPRPYAGRITLFRTRGHPLCSSFDEQYGWGELAEGGVAVEIVPGGHASILEEPHVRTIAAKLDRCLGDLNLAPKERTESCSKF